VRGTRPPLRAALPGAAGPHTVTRDRLGGGRAHALASEDRLAHEDEPRAASPYQVRVRTEARHDESR
jgi:hypothetical protein